LSGFVALFQRNGAPVDRSLLNSLTSSLAFRGPDARETWFSGPIGLGHTLLRTTRSSANERQPVSFDGRCWIVADARLDSRTELRGHLIGAGQEVEGLATDAELILHAYLAWKDDCVQRLRGDFSFAIWDARLQQLFCARDHFGIRPFYYAQTRDLFLCSNTLDSIRIHPDVSEELNDDAVADFLLFGLNCNNSTTTFKEIQRLPPAHFLSVSAGESRAQRYWSVPVDGRIRYRRQEEYVEHFQQHFRAAVADRLDVDRAGIFLSGGMDSGTVAATAQDVAANSSDEIKLRAYTVTYEKLIGDREGIFAKGTADFLGLPLQILSMDHIKPFEYSGNCDFASPEPVDDPLLAGLYEQFAAIAQDSRVVIDGEGIDNLMHFDMGPYLRDLLRRGEWTTLLGAVTGYIWKQRSRWHRLGSRMKRAFGSRPDNGSPPSWIAPDFARRVNLAERWNTYGLRDVSPPHPILPEGHASLELPQWTRMFEASDAGFTRQLVEVRYPFLDLRMVEYVLALPPYPLFLDKKLERDAMQNRLPAVTLRRPKTPLMGDPGLAAMQQIRYAVPEQWDATGELSRYISRDALSSWAKEPYSAWGTSCMRAVCFNFWLQSSRRVRYNFLMEVRNG
jgi:asparagine synthase (glutamine-hydrolysing)